MLLKFNSNNPTRNKYEYNPFRNPNDEKFLKLKKQEKKKKKDLVKYYKESNKSYDLAIRMIKEKEYYSYKDASTIRIVKENNQYIVICNSGLTNENEKERVFDKYYEVIDFINLFYDYDQIEKHYKEFIESNVLKEMLIINNNRILGVMPVIDYTYTNNIITWYENGGD